MSNFGLRLKQIRTKTGQTQIQLSEALGKSKESVKKYEKGERQPDLESVAKLSRHFNISADYILGLTDEVYSPGGGTLNLHYPEYKEFEPYIRDKEFIGYIRLAVKMFVNKINIQYIEQIIEQIIDRNIKKISQK